MHISFGGPMSYKINWDENHIFFLDDYGSKKVSFQEVLSCAHEIESRTGQKVTVNLVSENIGGKNVRKEDLIGKRVGVQLDDGNDPITGNIDEITDIEVNLHDNGDSDNERKITDYYNILRSHVLYIHYNVDGDY